MRTIRQAAVALLVVFPVLAFAAATSLAIKDGNGSAATLSQLQDPANSNYLAGVASLMDPTTGNKAAVKAASTAAAATDPALVVTISPNSGVTGTAAVGATASGAPVAVGGSYNTTPTALTNGQAGSLQLDANENLFVRQAATGLNPCLNPNVTMLTVSGATSGNSLTQIIALSGTTKTYLCEVFVDGVSGTTPTFGLDYGTGSNCATGTTVLLSPIATAAGSYYKLANIVVPAGQAVCYVDTGTTPVQSFVISYVQQ